MNRRALLIAVHLVLCLLVVALCRPPAADQAANGVRVSMPGEAGVSAEPLMPLTDVTAARPPGVPFKQMVLIAWDGAQLAHTQELMQAGKLPNLRKLARQGGMAPTWISTCPTATLAGFAEILCGYPPSLTGCYGILRHRPIPREWSVFYRLKQYTDLAIKTAFVAGKGKRLASTPGGPYEKVRADIDHWDGDRPRKHTYTGKRILEVLDLYAHPGTSFFCFFHFKEPDPQGHRYGENSREYSEILVELDTWLGEIRAKLRSNGVEDTTAVCVCTDHGFNEGTDRHYYSPDAWMATNWTKLYPGDMLDICPTVLAAFGIKLNTLSPPLTGRRLWLPTPPAAPALRWLNDDEFGSGGVIPTVGKSGKTRFEFQVRLHDHDGDEPEFVRLILRRNDKHWRTYSLQGDGGVVMARRDYSITLTEPLPPGRYSYRFTAKDGDGRATGRPTEVQRGPSMLPRLGFSKVPGLEDGVRPNTGQADDTSFFFKAVYTDNDGDPAQYVRVRLWRDGTFHRSLKMTASDPSADPMKGIAYNARRKLPQGSYQYIFEAEDKDGKAIGMATTKKRYLTVTASEGSLALTGLAAAPTARGAQVTFSLSSAARVGARVLNIAGRPVRTLCRARECEAGANRLVWSAQSDDGLPVPNGTYLVEVIAKTEDGARARALTRVRIGK